MLKLCVFKSSINTAQIPQLVPGGVRGLRICTISFIYLVATHHIFPPYSYGSLVSGSRVVLRYQWIMSSNSSQLVKEGARASLYLVQVSMHSVQSGNIVLNITRLFWVLYVSPISIKLVAKKTDLWHTLWPCSCMHGLICGHHQGHNPYLCSHTSSIAISPKLMLPVRFHTMSFQLNFIISLEK